MDEDDDYDSSCITTNIIFLILGMIISSSLIFGYQYRKMFLKPKTKPIESDITSTCNIYSVDDLGTKDVIDPYDEDGVYKDIIFDDTSAVYALQDPLGVHTTKLDSNYFIRVFVLVIHIQTVNSFR
jgi:hypothetical protein